MKIAIYETVHLECLLPLAECLKDSPYQITFFVNELMREDINTTLPVECYLKFTWVYMQEVSILSFYKFLDKQFSLYRFDLLWLNTIDSKHIVFALLGSKYKKMKLLINVHEINNFFRPHAGVNLKSLIRSSGKKILSHIAYAYLLNADKMKENIVALKLTKKNCYTISPVFYKANVNVQPPKEMFTVIIAGTVDERRRDYRIALNAWKIFTGSRKNTVDAELILAGGISSNGIEIEKICRTDKILQKTVTIFDREIPEYIFRKLLAGASVILSPLNTTTSTSDNIIELYGITKTSGNTYDAIRHAKPYIIPAQLTIPGEIETSAIRYSGEKELVSILEKLCNEKAVLDLYTKNAVENSQKFTYERMRQKVSDMLVDILKD
ncbi:MAG: hypothetical protein ABJB86_07120 [Bacteroidota bacterium]